MRTPGFLSIIVLLLHVYSVYFNAVFSVHARRDELLCFVTDATRWTNGRRPRDSEVCLTTLRRN